MRGLEIGGRGFVSVSDGALLDVVFEDELGGDGLIGNSSDGTGFLVVRRSAEAHFEGDLVVGGDGQGFLKVEEGSGNPRVQVDGTLFVGRSQGNVFETRGSVDVIGDPASDGDSLVSGALEVGGSETRSELQIFPGGRILTQTTAGIGRFGKGSVMLDGGASAQPETTTHWQISGGLHVGPRGLLFIANAGVDVGALSSPGQVLVDDGGAIFGLGSGVNLLRCSPGGTLTNAGVIQVPLQLACKYEQTATGRIFNPVASAPPAAPTGGSAGAGPTALARQPEPAAPSGPLVIEGDAKLAGTLEVQFMNGYAPSQGDRFELLRVSGQTTGAFENVIVRGLAPGAAFEQSFAGGELALTALNDAVALPTVGFKAKTQVAEGKKGLKLTVSRSGDTTQALTVRYAIDGSAQNGVDYQTLSGEVEIPARKKSAKLLLRPIADGIAEGAETIELEVLPGDDYTPSLAGELEIELQDAPVK
jgi:hypothetical protein